MHLPLSKLRDLYVQTYSETHARLVASKQYRAKPEAAAHDARAHAEAAVNEHKLANKRSRS